MGVERASEECKSRYFGLPIMQAAQSRGEPEALGEEGG